MNDMIKTGELDTKHFLIAIVAIVAIVALVFTIVFASGGFEGAAFKIFVKNDENLAVLDWNCFENCYSQTEEITYCKTSCELNALTLQ